MPQDLKASKELRLTPSTMYLASIIAAGVVLAAAVVIQGQGRQHKAEAAPFEDFPFRNTSLPWDVRVADLVSRLTLEEIRLQMATGGSGQNGYAPEIARLGIGKFRWGTECLRGDAEAGVATAFPQAIGLAAAFSPDLIYRVAEATAVEVRGKHNDFVKQGNYSLHTGINCFSPVVNIMRDPRWGRNQETYGEDPYLSGVYGANFIRGLQGNDTRYVRASGGCKHFDVHGGPENLPVSRFSFDAKVSERDWRTTFLPAFRMCVEAGTYSLMCSYNSINGVPACANKHLLTDVLRTEWGFKGFVISDSGAIENIISQHHYLNNSVDTVAACLNAGCSLELSSGLPDPVYFSVLDAVTAGKVTEERVREMVAPLFYTRMRLGEFDPAALNPYVNLTSADADTPQHKALALEAAIKSFVLLKNDRSFLPLNRSHYDSIAILGPMTNDPDQLFGDYAPKPPASDVTTPLQGLSPLAARVNFAEGCDDTPCQRYNAHAIQTALGAGNDVIFVALGTGQAVESEGMDRPDLELPGYQNQLLQDVINTAPSGTPIVLLLFTASPLNITFADQSDRVTAILECFFPAQATGEALRHVLLNDLPGAVPAGRLPFTWPMYSNQTQPMTNYSMVDRTYRYIDHYDYGRQPLYPFGYGLSYTQLHYVAATHTAFVRAGDPLNGTFWISNKGPYQADEVTQVYIAWQDYKLPAPKLQLAWFRRYTVPVSEQDLQVEFQVEARSMAVWMKDGWYIKPGMMDLFIGGEQPFQRRRAQSSRIIAQFKITGEAYLGKY